MIEGEGGDAVLSFDQKRMDGSLGQAVNTKESASVYVHLTRVLSRLIEHGRVYCNLVLVDYGVALNFVEKIDLKNSFAFM
jgi:hypothetical protein